MIRILAALAVAVLASGCASIVNGTMQPMKIDTVRADGSAVADADCQLVNNYGTLNVRSGSTVQMRRSSWDLDITCKDPASPDAIGRAISRANAGLAGNILFGGAIGAVVDHKRGTAYTYPTWVQLVFGKTLVFDRSLEKDGQPLTGTTAVTGTR
jgi:hypothetical protein